MATGDQFPWWRSDNWPCWGWWPPHGPYTPPIPMPPVQPPKPASPPYGLLVSMATRQDHGFGVKQFRFDLGAYETDEEWANRQKSLLLDALRMWEEMNGKGFWSPEKNENYERGLTPAMKEFLDKFTKGLDFPS